MRCRASFRRALRRVRGTAFGRGGGIYSFVVKMGVDMEPLYLLLVLLTWLVEMHCRRVRLLLVTNWPK